ncbi:TetR/AcrR family transcriptional regulator [Bradyrhizobium australiense]|uniref:TetR/AcrR family transcriptional regulator n=1 Tax=Bradyrhizobium australiense TaxID=2721161 RepID=A0A7Y4GYI2_9BRAD|nr:TetR/AcrR family transcriptional regulator [Bradyrhizobium australiense]NOJ44315.1 TetR/AcrR family transcriptional regulator [Bradyrhizobium australiense]
MIKKPANGRTRTNDPAGVRKRILDAAAAAFQKRGYHSTSTHDIIRAAGVTAGALHHHFSTKKVLALSVIQERVAQAVEKQWLEPVRSARGAEEGIGTAFEQIASTLDRSKIILGCPLNNLALELCAADSEFREAIEKIYDRWRKVIADKLRADLAGAFDPEALATFVIASYSGAVAQAKATQSTAPLRLCAEQLALHFRSRQMPKAKGARAAKP